MTDDIISRSAAIKALNTEIIKRRLLDDVNDGMLDEFDTESILRALPPAQPGWIPTSEKLPKKDGDYLVTTHSGQIARYIFIGGSSEEYWRRCATAWMPLPTPYREGGQNAGKT